jgi:thiol-disulfide isomerase/thioredoxin
MSNVEKAGAEYFSYLTGVFNDNMSYIPSIFLVGIGEYFGVHHFLNLPDGHNKPIKERLDYFKEKWTLVSGSNILYDVVQAQFYGMKLARLNPFTDTEKEEIYDLFRDKSIYAEALIAESDRMEILMNATKENNESIMNELPDVTQEQMLDAIITKYNGKVVVVDIWGTWCPPCLVAIKTIQSLKEEMKGKDVVWVYIANGSSPLDTWKQTCPGIAGEHYYVSTAQTQYWGINSYPTYMVYDRQGKQLAKYFDFPGNDVMKTVIEKGL